eukprot:CAMPEP_0181495068 /NCGR_PEP_ID=MMETSP1110-20121109/52171_1 /TAXON_ID=174948 /ORGANISM="Symbiodinium sp., Strain CCMP421" /LENGTH=135 /DNA_ID=CAMNT_0023622649 /DNA_START=240 /DNA_END=644 /DNA_ORIENTATION=+
MPRNLMVAVLIQVQIHRVRERRVLVLVIEIERTQPAFRHVHEPIREGHSTDLLLAVVVRTPAALLDEPHGLPGHDGSAVDLRPLNFALQVLEVLVCHALFLAHIHPGAVVHILDAGDPTLGVGSSLHQELQQLPW